MAEKSGWVRKTETDPGHSAWYVERFRSMARAGDDLAGEARFVDAMAPRGSRILDAGCGPAAHLRPKGRIAVGFGSGRGYEFDDFFSDVEEAGLVPDVLLSTWDVRAFTADSEFLVAVLRSQSS